MPPMVGYETFVVLSRTRVWTQEMDFYDQVVKASRAREWGYFWFV